MKSVSQVVVAAVAATLMMSAAGAAEVALDHDRLEGGPPPPAAYTAAYLADRQQIVDVVNSIGIYADLGRWEVVRSLFADKVRLDYTSMIAAIQGGKPQAEVLTPEQIIERWRAMLPGFEFLQHVLSNHVVYVDGNTAHCLSQVHATHMIGEDHWVVVGRYEHELVRTSKGWRVAAMKLRFGGEIGVKSVRTRAIDRAATEQAR